MLRPGFVPPAEIPQLRDLTRYRMSLVATRRAEKNRVEKLLEDACIKLSGVASDIFGVSGGPVSLIWPHCDGGKCDCGDATVKAASAVVT